MAKTLDQYLEANDLVADQSLAAAYEEIEKTLPLSALREAAGYTQKQMATLLHKSQAAVSKFEGRSDFLVSSLFDYVTALNGSVRVDLCVSGRNFSIRRQGGSDDNFFRLITHDHIAETTHEGSAEDLKKRFNDFSRRSREHAPAQHKSWPKFSHEKSVNLTNYAEASNNEVKSATA